jgi:hypothetical protein
VFTHYNETVWPAQIFLLLIAVVCVVGLLHRPPSSSASSRQNALIGSLLAALWAWMAIVYHFIFFSKINAAAWIFGGAFLVQAALLIRQTLLGGLDFTLDHRDRAPRLRALVGSALIFYSLFGYPIVGALAGDRYPATPTFGLPCPTTIFTLGLLLFARTPKLPISVLIVPLAWAVIGTSAAIGLGVIGDFGLPFAALTIVLLLVFTRPKTTTPSTRRRPSASITGATT